MPASPVKSTRATRGTPAHKAREAYHRVPTKTTAEDPNRYTKHPHEYGDLLIMPDAKGRTRLGGALQRDLVYWIERNTWGKNTGTPQKIVRPEWAKLSLTQLAKLCGSDRRTVARAIADLVARGIIEARDRKGCGPTVAKMYKLTPENWRKAAYYEPKAMELDEDAEDVDEETAEEPAEIETADEPERTVSPGKVSKPQPVAISPAKGAPAVTIRVVYRSVDLPFPVAFKARPGSNGRVQISCRATAPQFFASHSPSVSPASVDSAVLTAYTSLLNVMVPHFWGKAPDQPLIESIISAADGAPASVFDGIVRAKFKRGAGKHSTGLLIELAKDANRAWKLEQSRRAEETRQDAPLDPALLAELEAAANAPAAPQRAKCRKCKGTGNGPKVWSNRHGEYAARPTQCEACKGTGESEAA